MNESKPFPREAEREYFRARYRGDAEAARRALNVGTVSGLESDLEEVYGFLDRIAVEDTILGISS